MNIIVNIILAIFGGIVFGAIVTTSWAIHTNATALASAGLLVLSLLSVIGCCWIYLTSRFIFTTFNNALLAVGDIKMGLKEAQQLLRQYEYCTCDDAIISTEKDTNTNG